MRTHVFAALAACSILASGCSDKYRAQEISAEAAGLLAKADQPGPGGSLVVDLEGLRELGFIRADPKTPGNPLADMLLLTLPAAAVAVKDEAAGPLVARAAVMVALMREWNVWPHVQRFGVLAPFNPAMSPEAMADGLLLVLAVKGDAKANAELMRGLAAMDRVGGKPALTSQDGNLCFASPQLPVAICIKAGPGYFAAGTAGALKGLAPVAGASRSAAVPLLRVRAEAPGLGKGEASVEGRGPLKVAVKVEGEQAELVAGLEKAVNEALSQMDQARAMTRTTMQPTLDGAKTALAADAEAPAGMKKAAAALTLDQLLDPNGTYVAVRQSMKVSRLDRTISAEMTIPDSQITALTDSGALVGVAVVGILAAVAVPNFIKFQCRSKQSEAKANLRGAFTSQTAFFQEHDRYGSSFGEIGFQPERGTRYAYCMAGTCLPCTLPGCARFEGDENPCLGMTDPMATGEGDLPVICAVGSIDMDSDPDVWYVGEGGQLNNAENDCD